MIKFERQNMNCYHRTQLTNTLISIYLYIYIYIYINFRNLNGILTHNFSYYMFYNVYFNQTRYNLVILGLLLKTTSKLRITASTIAIELYWRVQSTLLGRITLRHSPFNNFILIFCVYNFSLIVFLILILCGI